MPSVCRWNWKTFIGKFAFRLDKLRALIRSVTRRQRAGDVFVVQDANAQSVYLKVRVTLSSRRRSLRSYQSKHSEERKEKWIYHLHNSLSSTRTTQVYSWRVLLRRNSLTLFFRPHLSRAKCLCNLHSEDHMHYSSHTQRTLCNAWLRGLPRSLLPYSTLTVVEAM
jgi:hypothetical protein